MVMLLPGGHRVKVRSPEDTSERRRYLLRLLLTFVSEALPRDEFLEACAQLDLHAIVSLSPIVHQQEVGVVVVQAGKPTLSLIIDPIMGWEATLQLKRS